MQITTDADGRVYVRWDPGGPWTVLHRDGTVTVEVGMGGADEWRQTVHGFADIRALPHRTTAPKPTPRGRPIRIVHLPEDGDPA